MKNIFFLINIKLWRSLPVLILHAVFSFSCPFADDDKKSIPLLHLNNNP